MKVKKVIEEVDVSDEVFEVIMGAAENTKRGSKTPYKPLPKDESGLVRGVFLKQLKIPVDGDSTTKFINRAKTLVATGYNRVVIGDYGPYVEFTESQIQIKNIKSRWDNNPSKLVKYIWMQTDDKLKTKVYYQKLTVPYADYKVGMYYVSPWDLLIKV